MQKRWYVAQTSGDGVVAQLGPFTAEEIAARRASNEIAENALACIEGEAEWLPIATTETIAAPMRIESSVPIEPIAPAAPPAPAIGTPPPAPAYTRLPQTSERSVPPSVAPSMPPPGMHPYGAPPAYGKPPSSNGGILVASLVLAGVVVIAALVVGLVAHKSASHAGGANRSIVRVVMDSGAGTGFFVKGPDEFAYVATAYHVVDSGETLLVEQTIETKEGQRHVEAYPEAEVVAFDSDADLAIVRLTNVRADHFVTLPLASAPRADEAVLSYGFPASNLAHRFGMVSKPGKILSLVKFPAYDHRTGEVVRNDAIDGLLISAEIEPGFSGGPTCNERGEVVGVNVTKDNAHRAQNGAANVSALRALLANVKPVRDRRDPTPDEVKALLTRIEREYLLLPMDRRWQAPEQEFVSANDLPRLEELVTTLRKLEGDDSRDEDTKLSGQATLGLMLARLPGRPLETYMDHSTRKALADCELREEGLSEFFGGLMPPAGADPSDLSDAAIARCSAVAFRPAVWDMTALTLQWEGKERDISVTKVENVDSENHVYRASVRFAGVPYLVDVWLATDGGRLRLKLFDNAGQASGMSATRVVAASAYEGTWHRKEPRTEQNFGEGIEADADTNETLIVGIATSGAVTVTHQVRRHVVFGGGKRSPCGGSKLDLGLEQTFTGKLRDGTVVGFRQKDAKPLGADMGRCYTLFTYSPDLASVLKIVGDTLIMYRTDGSDFPEAAEFQR